MALSPVCHVSRKPVTTPDHTALWPRWALSLPGESWPGRGPQGDGPGSCLSYNWTRTFLFFFTTKALKPQLEPTGCHRHSVPYEHLRGVSVDLYLCWQPARFTLTTYMCSRCSASSSACFFAPHSFFGALCGMDGFGCFPSKFISANALFPSARYTGVPYLSHKLLVRSSSVSFRHSVCQSHSMNHVNSNLAESLSLSCAYCRPLPPGCREEGMEEMMRYG